MAAAGTASAAGTARAAWATYVDSAEYMLGALVMLASLQAVGTQYECMILHPPAFAEEAIRMLAATPITARLVAVEDLRRPGTTYARPNYTATINKVHIWALAGFDRIGWLDSDLLILRPIDEILAMDLPRGWIAGAPGCTCNALRNPRLPTRPDRCPFVDPSQEYINTGVFVCTPDPALFGRLLGLDYNQPLPDQDAFCEFFAGRIRMLPSTYNHMNHLGVAHPEAASSDICVYHFTHGKPWSADVAGPMKSRWDRMRAAIGL